MSPRTLIIAILSAAAAFAAGYALLDSMQPSQAVDPGLVSAVGGTALPLLTGPDGTLTISPDAYAGIYGDGYVDDYAYYEDDDDDDHDDDEHDKDHDEKRDKDHDKDHDKKESKDRKSKHDDDDDHHDDHENRTEVGSLVQGLITTIANFRSAE
ncbi:MAG: hypothetical protein WC972_10305 [Trueperaceae bacterium]